MQHFPIFVSLAGRRVVLAGGGEAALAKLRLLRKTQAHLTVITPAPAPEIEAWADEGALRLVRRAMEPGDALCARLFYAANDDDTEDARCAQIAKAEGALTNMVDNLEGSQFITPAIVDRDPVTVAIGTEGAAPVLARAIKADLEARLPARLGPLARIGKAFRSAVEALPHGAARRKFWTEYYFKSGPEAYDKLGVSGAQATLETQLSRHLTAAPDQGRVAFVGAGPGDPELLTLKARKALDEADVVIYDRLVSPEILELARREALMINAGKKGFGVAMAQEDINAHIVEQASAGGFVVRLKSGDPGVYGRLDEEIDACTTAGLPYTVVPGITAASAAVAALNQSMTKRRRNTEMRFLTGHDMDGFAEQDWTALAKPGGVAAVYMGKRGARFLQGRLLMHGAAPDTAVSIVENASRPDQRIIATSLQTLAQDIAEADVSGPAVILYGLAPRAAEAALPLMEARV